MRSVGQFVLLLLVVGFVGAYFWKIAVTVAAFGIACFAVMHVLERRQQ
jgi:hypothetical protein